MSLLNELVQKYATTDLELLFGKVGINADKIPRNNRQFLKEVTLAQWLLESARATSNLAAIANNFAGLKWRHPEMVGFAEPINIQVRSEPVPVDFCKFRDIDAFLIGYWKFLTRWPYKGLEEHTNSPENFIGFLQRKGYAADLDYVNKVMRLLPEARQLLVSASGVVVFLLPVKLQVTRAPQEVGVGESFRIEGVASPADSGKVLLIKVDDRFPADGTPIGEDGKWQFDFVFHQAGNRKMQISTGSKTVEIFIEVVTPPGHNDDPEAPNPSGSIVINLSGSVGIGGVNKPEDVRVVKKRLHDLGYNWVGDRNSASMNTGTVQAIKLFQSIIAGRSTVAGDGRVDVGGPTHGWLQADNAPHWVAMPPSAPTIGFFNFERDRHIDDEHDFGTDWLEKTILAIAKDFQANHRITNPKAAPFTINNVSLPHGGDTPDHAGHETGLMCDVLLPRTDGKSGGIFWSDSNYDRPAAHALLKSIRKQKLVRAVFFNDERLIDQGLCTYSTGHDHHIHFEINPPVRT